MSCKYVIKRVDHPDYDLYEANSSACFGDDDWTCLIEKAFVWIDLGLANDQSADYGLLGIPTEVVEVG